MGIFDNISQPSMKESIAMKRSRFKAKKIVGIGKSDFKRSKKFGKTNSNGFVKKAFAETGRFVKKRVKAKLSGKRMKSIYGKEGIFNP